MKTKNSNIRTILTEFRDYSNSRYGGLKYPIWKIVMDKMKPGILYKVSCRTYDVNIDCFVINGREYNSKEEAMQYNYVLRNQTLSQTSLDKLGGKKINPKDYSPPYEDYDFYV